MVGYEAIVRVFWGARSIRPVFRDGSAFGPFGTAAAAAKLFKIAEEQIGRTLRLAANMGGLREWQLGGIKETDIFDPIAARNGILVATLAREGIHAAEEFLER